ncbi:MAG: tRNA-dihydrouridine synthase family protein [archaeon]
MSNIGSLKLNGELFLAPMADYTNVAFRALSKEYGAALLYTELISAKALTMKNKKTQSMLRVSEDEKPVFLQLFGNKPDDFQKAITMVEKKYSSNFAGYDLNCGCSVPKALKGKYGCSLMEDPQIVGQIVGAMKEHSNGKPVTVKMRLGLHKGKETFLEVAKEAEKAGADAFCLHPRFGSDGYGGNADWSKIKLLKENVSVPVIGNGDIKVPDDVLRMKNETNCDFEMIGRAAMGNAFFFRQASDALKGKKLFPKEKKDFFNEGKKFLELAKEHSLKTNDIRPYFISLAKGFEGASVLRNKFGLSKSIDEISTVFFSSLA